MAEILTKAQLEKRYDLLKRGYIDLWNKYRNATWELEQIPTRVKRRYIPESAPT